MEKYGEKHTHISGNMFVSPEGVNDKNPAPDPSPPGRIKHHPRGPRHNSAKTKKTKKRKENVQPMGTLNAAVTA